MTVKGLMAETTLGTNPLVHTPNFISSTFYDVHGGPTQDAIKTVFIIC